MKTLVTDDSKPDQVTDTLRSIKNFIATELNTKQELINRLYGEIDQLKLSLETARLQVSANQHQLQNSLKLNEGNKQLINKLLGDISKLQNDIEWFKRTYEKRSFLGYLKEKINRKH